MVSIFIVLRSHFCFAIIKLNVLYFIESKIAQNRCIKIPYICLALISIALCHSKISHCKDSQTVGLFNTEELWISTESQSVLVLFFKRKRNHTKYSYSHNVAHNNLLLCVMLSIQRNTRHILKFIRMEAKKKYEKTTNLSQKWETMKF